MNFALSGRAGHMPRCGAIALVALLWGASVQAQNARPPKAQLWIDVSTGTMAGMPEMELPGGVGGLLGGVMGARLPAGMGGGHQTYGLARTPNMMPPRVLDLAFHNSLRPGVEVAQAVPPGLRMGEQLPLLPPKPQASGSTPEREPGELPPEVEKPKGRVLIYWGCGEAVRPGQPRVIDLAKGRAADLGQAFAGRYVPDRGARVGPQHVLFPNERNTQTLSRDSSLVGEHRVVGDGVPASMKFTLGAAQDVMPAIELTASGSVQNSIPVSWREVPHARAYYLHAMSMAGDDWVLWSSSETADTGMGLFDYLPNATVDKWLKERVLLKPDQTQCAIPRGIFALPANAGRHDKAAPMLRMIAYGSEAHLAYPPPPADPKARWEPEWAVRLRLKTHTMAMLGEEASQLPQARAAASAPAPAGGAPAAAAAPPSLADQAVEKAAEKIGLPSGAASVLKGLFGR